MADTSPKDTIDELRGLVTGYARQQTVDPLKRLGAWVKFGFAGMIFLAVGGFLLALGVLRLLQTMGWDGTYTSVLSYGAVFLLLLLSAGLCFWAMTRRPDWLDEDDE